MPNSPPRAPRTPATPATSSRPPGARTTRSFRPSTIAVSAKRAISQRLKPVQPSKKRTKKTTDSLLVPKYAESSTSEEEKEENGPSKSEFILNGRVFRKATEFASQRKRTKTSHVWDKEKGFEIIDVKTGSRHYYCIECCEKKKDGNYVPFVVKGTSNITDHWKRKHGIDNKGRPVQRPSQGESSGLMSAFDFEFWKLIFIQWIVYCHIAFSQIENPYFKKLMWLLNERVATYIPCRNTIRKWVIEEFERRKRKMRHELRAARSNIHISFDLWTSPNCYAIMAIVAHYIDSTGARKADLIALRSLDGEHTGENMAALVLNVFREYKIGGRIGFFILDNASVNDVCVDMVLRMLYPRMDARQRRRKRLRCLGHVINIAAQAFLLGKQSQETLEQLEIAYRRHDFDAIAKVWRKQGVFGRLHNIIRYIRMTPQRRAEWRKIVIGTEKWSLFDGLELIQSNATRWNSYFISIGRALNCKLRIQQFCDSHRPKRGNGIENDRLKAHDWFLLEKLHDALEPFYEATLCSQSNNNTLSEWFYTLDYVLDSIDGSKNEFEALADENPESEEYVFLQAAAGAAWLKAEDYYKRVDESAAYYAASVLDPTFKWSWFEDRWGHDPVKKFWLEGGPTKMEIGVKDLVRELWEEEYKGKYGLVPAMDSNPRAKKDSSETKNPNDRFGGLHRHKKPGPKPRASSDRYMAFISTDCESEETNALEFWNARYSTQPDLARFALDMLAIPMMSAECERVFSSAKHLLTDSRNRLNPDIIEASECLKHWFGKPEEEVEHELQSETTEGATMKARKENESDVEDDVIYEVDSDGEIVWKDD